MLNTLMKVYKLFEKRTTKKERLVKWKEYMSLLKNKTAINSLLP